MALRRWVLPEPDSPQIGGHLRQAGAASAAGCAPAPALSPTTSSTAEVASSARLSGICFWMRKAYCRRCVAGGKGAAFQSFFSFCQLAFIQALLKYWLRKLARMATSSTALVGRATSNANKAKQLPKGKQGKKITTSGCSLMLAYQA